MPTQTVPIRAPSLVRVEVLDLTALREEAVNHYISLKPERSEWPEDKKKRLIISTTVEWGRVANDKSVFLLNENGGGPTRPLSSTVTANIALFAAMPRHGNDPGFKESTPFTRVKINDVTARELPSKLSVQLEEFIR